MFKGHRLQIVAVLLVAVFLISLAGGCGIFFQIELGHLYQNTITADDTKDGILRAHVYNLDVEAGETYVFEVEATSTAPIQVWECNSSSEQILQTYSQGVVATAYRTYYSDETIEIWVEAFEDECPAPYTMRVTKWEY